MKVFPSPNVFHSFFLQCIQVEVRLGSFYRSLLNDCELEAGEMAQWLRALAALAMDLGSVPSTYMMVNNCL